jgi:hypothetical protein
MLELSATGRRISSRDIGGGSQLPGIPQVHWRSQRTAPAPAAPEMDDPAPLSRDDRHQTEGLSMDPEFAGSVPESPPPASSADADHLKLLAIFHYIYAGLIALGGCCGSIYIFVGLLMATGQMDGQNPPPQEVGWMMSGMGAFFMLLAWGMALLVGMAGRYIQQRRRRLYCIIVAAIICVNIPIGTALGIFTLVVLSRPSVKQLFGDA